MPCTGEEAVNTRVKFEGLKSRGRTLVRSPMRLIPSSFSCASSRAASASLSIPSCKGVPNVRTGRRLNRLIAVDAAPPAAARCKHGVGESRCDGAHTTQPTDVAHNTRLTWLPRGRWRWRTLAQSQRASRPRGSRPLVVPEERVPHAALT